MSTALPQNVQPTSETHSISNSGGGKRHNGSDYEVLTSNPPREYGTDGHISGDEREYSRADLEANRNSPPTSEHRSESPGRQQQPQVVYVLPSQYFPPHRRYGYYPYYWGGGGFCLFLPLIFLLWWWLIAWPWNGRHY